MRKLCVSVLAILILAAIPAAAEAPRALDATGLQRLIDDTGGEARVSLDRATGAARFVRMAPGSLPLAAPLKASGTKRAEAFFRDHGSIFGVTDFARELKAVRVSRDAYGGEHASFAQTYRGVPVFGAELKAHFNAAGELYAVNGTFLSGLKVGSTASLSADDAGGIAIRRVTVQQDNRASMKADEAGGIRDEDLQDLAAVATTLMVFRTGLLQGVPGGDHLVYEVEVANAAVSIREFVYVDAHSGEVIEQITGIYENHALHREIYDPTLTAANLQWDELVDAPFPPLTGNVDWDNELFGAQETYYVFGSLTAGTYLSYDGSNATMITVNNDPSINCPNANWNGISTNYCTDVTGDDTVAHEWGHAYTEFTNNIIYQWQSGALSESYSDIWGEVIDFTNGRGLDTPDVVRSSNTCSSNLHGANFPGNPTVDTVRWLSGEDDPAFFGIPAGSGNAIRDLWDPRCFGDPGKVTDTEYHCATSDSGGVHSNSGIPNHGFALMVDGGTYNGETITALGLTKAAHIHWGAQNLLTVSSNFVDHADALEAACGSLTGINLPALSASTISGGLSGEVITAADCTEVAEINTAVEFRTPPAQCDFGPLLDPDAPALCDGMGSVQTVSFEDFEGGSLPAGWTASFHDVVDPGTFSSPGWSVVGGIPAGASGSFAAFAPDLITGDCVNDLEAGAIALDSPALVLPVGEVPHVAFDHWVATEFGWDGGNLKVSVNGAPYEVVPGIAYTFNPYNDSIIGGANDNPLGGEEGFTGSNGGEVTGSWGQSQVDLLWVAAPGDTVQFRFDFGTDGCNGLFGWYVDAVRAYTCSDEEFPICGDGVLGAGQECDDGNTDDGDGCSSTCQVEAGWECTDPTPGADSSNIVADESFEGGVPNADWTPFSTFTGIAGFPLCGPDNGCPAASLANTGSWLVWIGGLSAGVTSSVEQSVTIPTTATELTVYTLRGICDDPSDTLHVSLDGNDIGTVVCDGTDGDWVQQTFSVAGFNDGAAHDLFIGGTVGGTNGTHTNFFVDDVGIEDNVPAAPNPSVCTLIVTDLACNAGTVEYTEGIAGGWTVVDNEGTGVVWTDIATAFAGGAAPGGNFTGGTGEAASVSSDAAGVVEFDTELISNSFSLAGAGSACLDYLVNYQNFGFLDFLDVDVSTDGGSSWTNLLSWNEDHPPGGLFVAPGEAVSLGLSAYAGETDVQVRWHYYDPNFGDFDWYAQVDNVSLSCGLPGGMTGGGSVFDDQGVRYTHGFTLDCGQSGSNNLEINWEGNSFHLTSLCGVCSDDAAINQSPPQAGIDTIAGSGTGLLNGSPASITFRFTDGGEPGTKDLAEFTIVGAGGAATVSGSLDQGNHQAHN